MLRTDATRQDDGGINVQASSIRHGLVTTYNVRDKVVVVKDSYACLQLTIEYRSGVSSSLCFSL